jgi:hypothetical protein
MLRRRSVGQQVQTAAGKEHGIDIAHRDELFQHQGLVAGRPEFFHVVSFDDDVLARRVLARQGEGAGGESAIGC